MNDDMRFTDQLDLSDNTKPIVMVDDEELDFFAASRYYKRSRLKNPFIRFENGELFLAYLEEVKAGTKPMPILVLMDINMPRMNGFDVVAKMREDEFFNTIPVVAMLSSSTDWADRERAETVGVDNYLVKPFEPTKYVDFFNSLLPEDDADA